LGGFKTGMGNSFNFVTGVGQAIQRLILATVFRLAKVQATG
jgi:hypothetical protein